MTRSSTKYPSRLLCAAMVAWLGLAGAPTLASAQSPSANDYFEGCQIAAGLGATGDAGALSVTQQLSVSLCLGFVDGANGALWSFARSADEGAGTAPPICADEAPTNFDALTVWVGYLQTYPIQLSDDAFPTFLRAMQETFPCP